MNLSFANFTTPPDNTFCGKRFLLVFTKILFECMCTCLCLKGKLKRRVQTMRFYRDFEWTLNATSTISLERFYEKSNWILVQLSRKFSDGWPLYREILRQRNGVIINNVRACVWIAFGWFCHRVSVRTKLFLMILVVLHRLTIPKFVSISQRCIVGHLLGRNCLPPQRNDLGHLAEANPSVWFATFLRLGDGQWI